MPSVHAGDLDVYYNDNGTQGGAGTIIFVHGNWATSSWWEPVLTNPLAKPWRTIAYDVRGRGRTTGPDSDYSISSLAADLGTFIAALGLESPHLVGHSLGSAVVMQYCARSPGASPVVDGRRPGLGRRHAEPTRHCGRAVDTQGGRGGVL